MAAITIGSKGGRCALADALGGMRVKREPRCVAVDVVKDIADELLVVSRLHTGEGYIMGHGALLPTPNRVHLSNSRI